MWIQLISLLLLRSNLRQLVTYSLKYNRIIKLTLIFLDIIISSELHLYLQSLGGVNVESSPKKEYDIVVAGDVTIDWLQWTAKYHECFKGNKRPNWALYEGTQMKAEQGGALLLGEMVKKATDAKVATHIVNEIEKLSHDDIIHSITILDVFALSKTEDSKDKEKTEGIKKTVFRVRKHSGFCGPITNCSRVVPNDNPDADMIILDDAGNGFRENTDVWPKAILETGKNPLIILKMSHPLASGDLWQHLVEIRKEHSKNLILIIDANDLRKLGVNISRHLSWEQTTRDFYWQMIHNPEIKSIAACKNVIVKFGLDGVIHYTNNEGKIAAYLYYDPVFGEDGYKDQYEGDMQGLTAAFVAAFSAQIVKEGLNGIENGIFEGIRKSRKLLQLGFGDATQTPSYPIPELFKPEEDQNTICKVDIPDFREKTDGKNNDWRILEECTKGKLESIACNAVLQKTEEALKQVPSARFGKLLTLDKEEIENYRCIKNLMSEYLEKTDVNVPLSIAVFGPPGSGKSFGVTELALSLGEKRVKKIEFNVSQFTSTADLAHAFHNIRDEVLRGKIPLVFFDEFDTSFNGKLGWLKYFLAPMQDGMFKDGELMHPIGRAIFVFAGGTSQTFQEFSREYLDETMKEDKKKEILKEFHDAKGTDFVSRLRGYVNIMGPNRAGVDDAFFIIRRALLLRSLLQKRAPNIFEDGVACIDRGVLRAFLRVPAYKHGARSMEAIIDMSILAGKRRFNQAALPPAKQLELHVNSEIFSKLVLLDVLFDNAIERMAMANHAQYIIDQKDKKDSNDPTMQPWETLREDFKDSSRNQIRQIREKLQRVGFDIIPFVEKPAKRFEFTAEQVEILAEMEHERWIDERKNAGWVFGIRRDPDKKISPYLVPWSQLTEEVKDWDRNPVRKIPERLEAAGLDVYPLQ